MKHIIINIAVLCIAAVLSVGAGNLEASTGVKPATIVIISDTHLLAPSLYDDGEAASAMARTDMKLALLSDSIMLSMVGEIEKLKPQLVLITGDLTHNGERGSHERMAHHLAGLKSHGITPLVIPGNHDVRNPYSRAYLGSNATPVATVESSEFAALYRDYGYGSSSCRDTASLSYVCEPVDGLAILAIDTNRYDENITGQGSGNVYYNGGRVKAATLQWIEDQLARLKGKTVIAMMHHHLLEHIDGEEQLMANYLVADHNRVAQVLKDGGVKLVFTGHLHITDAVTADGITDVATGSASTYPMPLRLARVDAGVVTIDTRFGAGLGQEILDKGREQLLGGRRTLTSMVVNRLWPRLSKMLDMPPAMLEAQGVDIAALPRTRQQMQTLIDTHLGKQLEEFVLMVSKGGEDPARGKRLMGDIEDGMRALLTGLFKEGDGDDVVDFLMENAMERVRPTLESALLDINGAGTPGQSSTPDHHLVVK